MLDLKQFDGHTPGSKHILGMEPDSVLRQIIRNYFGGQKPDRAIGVEDIIAVAMEFNRWLVEMNESLQKLTLDKINTTLPAPILSAPTLLREQGDKAMRALESLTPSGSEFVGDVERCVAFVKDVQASQHRVIVNFKKSADTAREQLAKLADKEFVGRIMHESWSRTKRSHGFHGYDTASICLGCRSSKEAKESKHLCSDGVYCPLFHADLVPWEQLPEAQKDINRHAFDAVLAELGAGGTEGK